MSDTRHLPSERDRRLVQQLIEGRIPAGTTFDECRALLASDPDESTAFEALFMLLRGALADPFLGMDETRQVVPILAALTRRELTASELLSSLELP